MKRWWISAALGLMVGTAYAATPEQEAIAFFTKFCVVTQANPNAINVLMQDVIKANAGGAMPVEKLIPSGIKADHAWGVRAGASRQLFLVTTIPGLCAVHMNAGDAKPLREEFTKLGDALAKSSGQPLVTKEDKQQAMAHFTAYEIGAKEQTKMVLAISTADQVAPSGTKHLMTYSPMVK